MKDQALSLKERMKWPIRAVSDDELQQLNPQLVMDIGEIKFKTARLIFSILYTMHVGGSMIKFLQFYLKNSDMGFIGVRWIWNTLETILVLLSYKVSKKFAKL